VGLIVLFVSGLLIGFWSGGYAQKQVIARKLETPPKDRTKLIMRRMTRWLDLTEEQQKEIFLIVSRAQADGQAEWSLCAPKIQEIREQSRQEISKLLNEEQLKKYDRYAKKQREKYLKTRKKRNHQPDRP